MGDPRFSKTNRMIAHAALAHKLARASYYIMRDGVAFDRNRFLVKVWPKR